MKLRTTDIIILLSLGIILIARSVWGFIRDVDVDMSKSNSIFGKVCQADIRKIEETTFRFEKYKTVFAIQVDNSKEKFAIDRGYAVCTLLKSQIKAGDSIKIYYRSSTGSFNTHIFQIEKDNFVLINSGDYSSKELSMIVLMAVFGVLITTGVTVWAIKQSKS